MKIEIELTKREQAYFRLTAMNRFFDNVEKALRGDKECRDNLLGEDLADAREYYETVFRKVQDKANGL